MVKGVMRVDDARRAVEDVGATALSVSNHGGNNLDGTPASIRALARGGRGRRRRGRGPPGRRRAPRQRRRQGARAGRPRGDDRPAVPVGARRRRARRAWRTCSTCCAAGIDSALLGLGRASMHDLDRIRPTYPGWLLTGASALDEFERPSTWPRPARRPTRRDRAARAAPAARDGHDDRVRAGARVALARATSWSRRRCPYGSSGEHAGFAGTLSIGREALSTCSSNSARSAAFAPRAVRVRTRRERRAARRGGAPAARRGARRPGLVARAGAATPTRAASRPR